MTPADPLVATRFEAERSRLTALAARILGSHAEAEDAVQDTWLRLQRNSDSVDNLGGWLTTVVSRMCLDRLRSRKYHGEPDVDSLPERTSTDPQDDNVLADSIGAALFVVIDTLPPRERVAFILHETFDVPLTEVAEILGTSHDAARQLASRARRRVRGAEESDRASADIVDAFLAAARDGRFEDLLELLADGVTLDADAAARALGAENLEGRDQVAGQFAGRARGAISTTIDGEAGAVWLLRGDPKVLFAFAISDGLISQIRMMSNPDALTTWSQTQPSKGR